MFERREQFILPITTDNNEGVSIDSFFGVPTTSWHDENRVEGELAVDVLETEEAVIVVAPMAGANTDRIQVHLHNDMLTIRGERLFPVMFQGERHAEENYWGTFSRAIILPAEVRSEMVNAEFKNGVLVVTLPKAVTTKRISVMVIDE